MDIAYAPTIGFHWANKAAGTLVLQDDGIFAFLKQNGTRAVVDCDVPFATTAWAAHRVIKADGGEINFSWIGPGGQPNWVWGSNDGGNMYVWNPANFNVNYAGRAGYAEPMGSAFASAYHGNPGIITIPSGGTWVVFLGSGLIKGKK